MTDHPSIESIQKEIVEEFSFFDDWQDKYKYIMDLAKEAEAFPEAYRTDANKVKGCQSQVWLHAEKENGRIRFYGDSDALIVKGLVTLLIRVFSHHPPSEILSAPLFFVDDIGLSTHLSPTRSNGLASMVKQIRMYALAFQAQNTQG